MSQNPVRNVRGRFSPQGRAHAQSPDNPDKITVGSAEAKLKGYIDTGFITMEEVVLYCRKTRS
jgi:hypothetical protein